MTHHEQQANRWCVKTHPTKLVTQLPWTHNLLILSQANSTEEREFYLKAATREKWTKRELERQLKGSLFERVILSPPKVSPAVRQLHPRAPDVLLCASKDEEVVEYALNRTLAPAVIAQYETQLPDKKLLEAKLQEFYLQYEQSKER